MWVCIPFNYFNIKALEVSNQYFTEKSSAGKK